MLFLQIDVSGVKAVSYDKIGTIQRRLAWPRHAQIALFSNGLLSLVAEHSLCKRKVGGSTPPLAFFFAMSRLTQKLRF